MDIEVKPEPADDEREAILAALDPRDEPPVAITSAWSRAGLHEAIEESHP